MALTLLGSQPTNAFLDAAEGLIMIARGRMPNGDFRVGDLASFPLTIQLLMLYLLIRCNIQKS